MSGNIRRRATVSAIAALGMAGVVAASADAQAQQQSKQNDFRIRAPQLSQSSGTEKPSGQMKKSQSARSSQDVQAVQQALKQEGHDLKVDGIMGPQTREALRKYQSEHGLKTTGTPNQETMQQLGVAGQGAGAGSMGRGGHMGSGPSTRGGMGERQSGVGGKGVAGR